jgi:hypothetical protein
MTFEELPGGVLTPPRPLSSPAKVVVGHILWELRRPGRSRNRAITIFLAAATLILFILGKRHVVSYSRLSILMIDESIIDPMFQQPSRFSI